MTKPNLYTIRKTGKVYSIHTYANEQGISKQAASKRLQQMVKNGSCRFTLRNDTQPIHKFLYAASNLWDWLDGVVI